MTIKQRKIQVSITVHPLVKEIVEEIAELEAHSASRFYEQATLRAIEAHPLALLPSVQEKLQQLKKRTFPKEGP